MALPVVRNALECADYSSTVAPYIYQLQPLPKILFESITNPAALKQIYLDTNPLITALAFSIAISPIFLVVSEINKNYSQVDRVWSILPTIYNVHYAFYAWASGMETTRVGAVALASTVWSTRLTYNYYRKGGYSVGSEDYRWAIVKEKVGPGLFFIFNVTFISLAQSLLLFTVAMPTYIILLTERLAAWNGSEMSKWSLGDTLALAAMLGFVALSYVGDQQQWNYQNAKQRYRKTAKVPPGYNQEELDRGFNTRGVFAYSRHPNFAAEQSVWVTLYLWSCYISGTLYNWAGIGVLAYLFLFQASTWLTELLSSRKYPEYQEYQKQVGKFVPTTFGGNVEFSKPAGSHRKQIDGTKDIDLDAVKARERYDLRT